MSYFIENIYVFSMVFFFSVIFLLILTMFQQAKLAKQQQQQNDVISGMLASVTLNNEVADRNYHQQQQQFSLNHQQLLSAQQELKTYFEQQIADLRIKLLRQLSQQNEQVNENQHKAVDQLIHHLNQATQANREELAKSLTQGYEQMAKRIDGLTESTDKRLQDISGQVEKRLADGFEKTTQTFNDILKRLALIDDAQKKITELSTNVVSLQEVLADKRSRGAFGEVQLNSLIRNVLPEQSFSLQHTLSNGRIADCILFLPEPTGNVVIDSKFPLESYQRMMDNQRSELERKAAERQFKSDIKKHINDISDKYLIEKETAEGAIMFIPAEAIFAEIHAHQTDLVEFANKKRIWLASPTTLMAILTTARAVLKDDATKTQIHVIQQHLSQLATDFGRFRGRFDNLAKHIDQAASDVKQIHTSADKISKRFSKIEQVELSNQEIEAFELANNAD
ncbi:DNA recombination protein RmuC [Colwelliaceae bacterium 6471]